VQVTEVIVPMKHVTVKLLYKLVLVQFHESGIVKLKAIVVISVTAAIVGDNSDILGASSMGFGNGTSVGMGVGTGVGTGVGVGEGRGPKLASATSTNCIPTSEMRRDEIVIAAMNAFFFTAIPFSF
jgi:hypothetical protein